MKYLVLVAILCSFIQNGFSQEKPLNLSDVGVYFTQDTLNIPCGELAVSCFYRLISIQDKDSRPPWMGKQKEFFGILIRSRTTSRGYSDAVSIMGQSKVSLKNPVIEFKSPSGEDGMRTMLIVYQKGTFPKER